MSKSPDDLHRLVAELRALVARAGSPRPEPWLDKRALAAHLTCSVRSVEQAMADGLPHAIIFGRAKFRVTEVEPWLEAHGDLDRRAGTWEDVVGSENGAGTAGTAPRPTTEGGAFDGS